MRKQSRWVDALIGLILALFVAGSYFYRQSFLEGLELKAYDMRAQLRGNIDPAQEIVIVAIDDDSIARLGRWPWPRTRIAEGLQRLREASPRVIGLDILYTESALDPGMLEVETLRLKYQELVAARKLVDKGAGFETEFASASARLDTDAHLLAAIRDCGNVVLPIFFQEIGSVTGGRPPPLAPAVSSYTASVRVMRDALPMVGSERLSVSTLPYVEAAAGLGHVNVIPDLDGIVRRETPAIQYGNQVFPSYALALVARYLNLRPDEIQIVPGQSVQIGNTRIPLDEQSMLVTFNGDERSFRYYSFHEILDPKFSTEVFRDRLVIVGPSAVGVGTLYATPLSRALPSVEFVANVAENILHRRFIQRPAWAWQAELGALALFGLFIMFFLPRLKALGGATVTTVFLLGLLGAGAYFFKERAEWLKVTYPAFLLVAGYLVIVTQRLFFTEKGKEFVEASQIETNKMLGLSFQGQGMFDLAFEKFRLCPLDDNMAETLYNLGLDFERKRQYAKAVSVYQHIATQHPKYKDIQDKVKTLQAAAEGAVFGGVGAKAAEGTVLVTGGASVPTLGRYEIQKELGRGAMGIVYLGKDPKINRQVAIKTLMLEEGSSPAETKEIRERFFREAESAGTLNHPGIVRIFDAGEDQEVCYIAMELLDGHDLTRFIRKENLLLLPVAVDYAARVAEALDYAHAQGIVHRDIKPANIMLLKDGAIRVTDFGIARITASSKTASGTVMGTPSYMSPEQVAGKKVDGRADLFSLGVALFELTTGEKPFKGGEGIGTLLFQIANDPEPDPQSINPKMPAALKTIIHKALAKNPDKRYQKGGQMAADLRALLEKLKSGQPVDEPAAASAAEPEQPEPEAAVPVEPAVPVEAAVLVEATAPAEPTPSAEAAVLVEATAPVEATPLVGGIGWAVEPGPAAVEFTAELTAPVEPIAQDDPVAEAQAGGFTAEEVAGTLILDPGMVPPEETGNGAPCEAPEIPVAVEFQPADPFEAGFTPEQVAQSLAPEVEPTQSVEPEPVFAAPSFDTEATIRIVESILPQAAPGSVKPEEMTNPNLADEIRKFKEAQVRFESAVSPEGAPSVSQRAVPIEPPDPDGTMQLTDPSTPV